MHSHELSRNCWLITQEVGRWLAQQDELTRALHQTAVETIQTCTDSPMEAFLIEFEAEYPLLLNNWGRKYIEEKAEGFLNLEFIELSAIFAVFYEEFNSRYFASSLPRYRVKVLHNIPVPESLDARLESIQVNFDRRDIAILYDGWPEDMLGCLVRLMAYIRVGGQRSALEDELRRLQTLGAPTPDEVDRLKRVGWRMFSTSPWSVS